MPDRIVPEHDCQPNKDSGFNTVERAVLASGACVLSAWFGMLAWMGYKLVILIV